MPLLLERVKRLEYDLRLNPMAHSLYDDLPFAVFCYGPGEEWLMRAEMTRLKTRLENDHIRRVIYISLADLLWRGIDESEGMDAIVELEAQAGFEEAQSQIKVYLSDREFRPLPELLADQLRNLDPERDLAFIWRTGSLAPHIYRVSILMDQMKGKTRVPSVLFMPAILESTNVRFIGLPDTEPLGSYHTKVYID